MTMQNSEHTQQDANWYQIAILAEPDELMQISQVFIQTLGMNSIDAQQLARSAPGVLPRQWDHEQANLLAEQITQQGLKTVALPVAEIPLQNDPHIVHHLCCRNEDLVLYDLRGELSAEIPWSGIDLISVGYVPLEMAHHENVETTVVFRSTHRNLYGHQDTQAKSGPAVWILTRTDLPALFVNHNEMNYEYLAERMTGSATANFKIFLQDLVQYATQAYLTPATRAYLEQGLLKDYEFESREALRHYTQHHAILHTQMAADL